MATSSAQEDGDAGTAVTYTEWIDVQKKTFTNWVNEKLKGTPYKVEVLENDLDDGVTLIKLLETLANKKMHKRYNANPQISIHKRENLEIALEFMTKVENIKLENIGASDIIDHNLPLILALVWALILQYQIAKRQPDTVESTVEKESTRDATADELLLGWIRMVLPHSNVDNLTSAWNDGQNLSALVDYCELGLIPNHAFLDPKNRLENVRHAMTLAEQHLNIPQVIHPEDLVVDHPDKFSTMTYLSQFWWRSRHQQTSPQQEGENWDSKQSPDAELPTAADLEMRLKVKEEELKLLKQQAEGEKEQLLEMVAKRDQEHKRQMEFMKREVEQNVLTIQEELRKQLELEKKELETALEMEKVSNEMELLKRDKRITEHKIKLQSVQSELQTEKQKMQSIQEELATEKKLLETELKYERLSKEQELQKKEEEIIEHKKELEAVRKELETEKQKPPAVAVHEHHVTDSNSQGVEAISLQALNYVEPALRKNHITYFRGFFLLRTSLTINGHATQIGPNEQGWLTLRCPTTYVAVSFNDLYTIVSAAMQKYSGTAITNYWCVDMPLFQLNISSTDSLQKLLNSKDKLQKELTMQISRLFKKSQVQLQPQVFLIIPSISSSNGKIVHITVDNAAQSMAQWEGSAAFTFQDVFQQWNDHSRKNEPTLGTDSLSQLVEALEEIVKWFQFGIHLGIPHYKLSIIKADHQGVENCKVAMLQWWMDHTLERKWSTIVHALIKAGKRVLAHKIALDHGVPWADYSDVSEAATTVEPPADMDWRGKLAEMEDKIKIKLAEREDDLKRSQQKKEALTRDMAEIRGKIVIAQRRVTTLLQEKDALERDLKLRTAEIEVLRLKNSSITTIKEQEIAHYQKQLESTRKELEAEKQKISPLQEELQRKRVEVAEKMKDIQYLTEARDRAKSELEREREKAEQKSKELTAAVISHAACVEVFQLQFASLKESKTKSDQMIDTMQKAAEKKEAEIEHLLQQITAKEEEVKQQTNTLDVVELEHMMELEDMKTKIMELQYERDCAHTAARRAQEETGLYAAALLEATKLKLKWSDRKEAPERIQRGAAVVRDTTVYVIGSGSRTIYSYRLDRDKWGKHSECPHINPGLVIINNLLTAVGGKEGYRRTSKLISWNRTKRVETFPPMQTPRESPAVVHYENYVIVMGGDHENSGIELLHIPSLHWSTATSLPRSLTDITATLCHDGIITMDYEGSAYTINIETLLSSIRWEESFTEHSQWISLPQCPAGWATLSTICGQCVVVSWHGIFQLQEGQWVRIGDMSVPSDYCIVCVECDQMVVVGGHPLAGSTSTDAVRVAVIV